MVLRKPPVCCAWVDARKVRRARSGRRMARG